VYFVPSDTIIGRQVARALGIRNEQSLFGGVVPYRFLGTKIITHGLVEADSYAPEDWRRDLIERLDPVVLLGFSVFTKADAIQAAIRLLEHGPLRIKPVRETGGLGQVVIPNVTALQQRLDGMDAQELFTDGLVLEEDLTAVTTYSVGQVRVDGLIATYYGTQHVTPDNSGVAVYGGSDLFFVRGDFDALLAFNPPAQARLAVAQARAYDAAVMEVFPEIIASRRNYDVAQGCDGRDRQRSGVLEQSWRIGGASGAEIAALEAFRAAPGLRAIRAATVETYGGGNTPPPDATVYFHGTDEEVGPVTKYVLTERYDDA
jgi:hypothetical protein